MNEDIPLLKMVTFQRSPCEFQALLTKQKKHRFLPSHPWFTARIAERPCRPSARCRSCIPMRFRFGKRFFLGRKYLEKQHHVSRVSEHLKWWVVFLEHTRTFCKNIFSTNRVTLQSFAMRHCSQCFQLTSFGSCCGEWQGTWLSFLRSKLQFIVDRFHPSIANYMSYTPEF